MAPMVAGRTGTATRRGRRIASVPVARSDQADPLSRRSARRGMVAAASIERGNHGCSHRGLRPHQGIRPPARDRRPHVRRRGRRGLRLPRPQRRRQDDHDPDPAGPPATHVRTGRPVRPRRLARGAGGPRADLVRRQRARLPRRADGRRAARLPGPAAPTAAGLLASGRRALRARSDRRHQAPVAGQSPEGRGRPGVHGRGPPARSSTSRRPASIR